MRAGLQGLEQYHTKMTHDTHTSVRPMRPRDSAGRDGGGDDIGCERGRREQGPQGPAPGLHAFAVGSGVEPTTIFFNVLFGFFS